MSHPYKVFVTGSTIAEEAKAVLYKNNCKVAFGDENDSPEDLCARLSSFKPDALIVRKGKITKKVLQAANGLKVITKHGVGVDNIDVDYATEKNIPVMITALANFESVAEHALALILAMLRRITVLDKKVRKADWDKKGYDGHELLEKTLGLVGYGRIGRRLSELVSPFKMEILVFDPYVKPESMPDRTRLVSDLKQVLEQSDILSIHCPLTSDTKGLIGKNEIAFMKPGACIINTARGAVIDETALIAALKNGHISSAALDTLEKEPPDAENPLFKMNNVILTNHVGGVSDNSFRNMGIDAVSNVLSVLKDGDVDIACVLNRDVLK